jgi:hypothetical protein
MPDHCKRCLTYTIACRAHWPRGYRVPQLIYNVSVYVFIFVRKSVFYLLFLWHLFACRKELCPTSKCQLVPLVEISVGPLNRPRLPSICHLSCVPVAFANNAIKMLSLSDVAYVAACLFMTRDISRGCCGTNWLVSSLWLFLWHNSILRLGLF